MSSPDNYPDFVVFEQEVVVGDVGDDVAGKHVLPPAIGRADSTWRGVEDFGYFLHHVVNYAGGHGFGCSGIFSALLQALHCSSHIEPHLFQSAQ